jgi:hypothetical protein
MGLGCDMREMSDGDAWTLYRNGKPLRIRDVLWYSSVSLTQPSPTAAMPYCARTSFSVAQRIIAVAAPAPARDRPCGHSESGVRRPVSPRVGCQPGLLAADRGDDLRESDGRGLGLLAAR